jgi:hypothetical protein
MRILSVITMLVLVLSIALPAASAIEYPPEPPQKLIIHTVKSGEFHLLAGYYYLDCRQWKKTYQVNLGSIDNPNKIYPGQQLYIYVDQDWTPPFDLDAYVNKWRPYLLSGTAL